MANNADLIQFIGELNTSINLLLIIRDDCAAADRLWPDLNAEAKLDIREREQQNLVEAKASVAALEVP